MKGKNKKPSYPHSLSAMRYEDANEDIVTKQNHKIKVERKSDLRQQVGDQMKVNAVNGTKVAASDYTFDKNLHFMDYMQADS